MDPKATTPQVYGKKPPKNSLTYQEQSFYFPLEPPFRKIRKLYFEVQRLIIKLYEIQALHQGPEK